MKRRRKQRRTPAEVEVWLLRNAAEERQRMIAWGTLRPAEVSK